MVADIAINGKKTSNSRFENIDFQFNQNVNSRDQKSKDAVKSALKMNRGTWTLEQGVEALRKRIDTGYTVQPGINIKSTSNEDITHYAFSYIDYDGFSKASNKPIEGVATLEELLSLPTIKNFCSFYQESLSSRKDAISAHFFFIFSRDVAIDEQRILVKLISMKIEEELNSSNSQDAPLREGVDPAISNNPGQVCFAGTAQTVTVCQENSIDVDQWLDEAEKLGLVKRPQNGVVKNLVTKKTDDVEKLLPTSHPESSGTESPLEYIQRVIVEGVLEGDYSKLYCLHPHKFFTSSRKLKNEAVEQLDGSNPFSPTDSSGESFTVTLFNNGLPPIFYDRSGHMKKTNKFGEDSTGGTIIDYFYAIGRMRGKYQKGGFNLLFKSVVHDICDHFEVDRYDFETLDNPENQKSKKKEFEKLLEAIVDDCLDRYSGKIFYISERQWYGWIENKSKWDILDGSDFTYAEVFCNYITEKYGRKIADNVKVRSSVMNSFKNGNTRLELPEEIIRYIPMREHLFNVETKTIEPNNGQAYNRKVYKWNYNPESINEEFIERFKQYWGEWACSKTYGRILLIWLVLNIQRQAWRTEKILGVIGTSGKGKTSYGLLINKLINGLDDNLKIASGYAGKPDTTRLMSNGNHSSAVIEGMTHILLEELTGTVGDKSTLAILKNFSGNIENRNIMINPKGMKEREIPFYGAITFDCENFPSIPSKEAGYFRRIMFVQITDQSPGVDSIFFKEIDENLEMIFNWAIQQPTEALVNEFKVLCNSGDVRKAVKNVRLNNDPMANFIIDRLHFTDNYEDKLSDNDIFLLFNNIARSDMGYGSQFRTKNSFTIQFKKVLCDKTLFGDWMGDHKDMKIDGKKVRGYTNLRWRKDDDDYEGLDTTVVQDF